jgi:hypothetical protein
MIRPRRSTSRCYKAGDARSANRLLAVRTRGSDSIAKACQGHWCVSASIAEPLLLSGYYGLLGPRIEDFISARAGVRMGPAKGPFKSTVIGECRRRLRLGEDSSYGGGSVKALDRGFARPKTIDLDFKRYTVPNGGFVCRFWVSGKRSVMRLPCLRRAHWRQARASRTLHSDPKFRRLGMSACWRTVLHRLPTQTSGRFGPTNPARNATG